MKKLLLSLSVVLLAQVANAATSVNPNKFRCEPSLKAGRTDAVCISTSNNGGFYSTNGSMDIVLSRSTWVENFEDFLGSTTIGANGTSDAAKGPWMTKDTSAAGSPTLAILADGDNGQFEMTAASTDEAEVLTLYWNDEQNIDTDLGPVMIIRLLSHALPTSAGNELVFGLASAQNDTLNSVANNAWFYLTAGASLLIESDDATTDDDDNDTGIDLVADTWYDFKIDCSVPTDCDFFYRATAGGDWTELLSTTAFSIGADIAVQPFVQLMKSGTGTDSSVPSIYVDYVLTYWKRE